MQAHTTQSGVDGKTASSPIRQWPLDDEETIDHRSLLRPTSSGCIAVLASALVSCVLLFLNGGVVMALVNLFDDQGWTFARDDRIAQFIVLIGPVLLLVVQWMMIDYVWVRLRRRN